MKDRLEVGDRIIRECGNSILYTPEGMSRNWGNIVTIERVTEKTAFAGDSQFTRDVKNHFGDMVFVEKGTKHTYHFLTDEIREEMKLGSRIFKLKIATTNAIDWYTKNRKSLSLEARQALLDAFKQIGFSE